MAFEVFKQGKLADQLEERAYEWCAYQIEETFEVSRKKNGKNNTNSAFSQSLRVFICLDLDIF